MIWWLIRRSMNFRGLTATTRSPALEREFFDLLLVSRLVRPYREMLDEPLRLAEGA